MADSAPVTDGPKPYFNSISREVGKIRERHLVSLIEEKVNSQNRVLVVYGEGHLVEARAVLKEMFGLPRDEKLF